MHHIASESLETTENPPRDSRETSGDDQSGSSFRSSLGCWGPPGGLPEWSLEFSLINVKVPGVLLSSWTSSWSPRDLPGSPRGLPWVLLEFSWAPPGSLEISSGASWDPPSVLGVLLGASRGSPWVLGILLGSPGSILGTSCVLCCAALQSFFNKLLFGVHALVSFF